MGDADHRGVVACGKVRNRLQHRSNRALPVRIEPSHIRTERIDDDETQVGERLADPVECCDVGFEIDAAPQAFIKGRRGIEYAYPFEVGSCRL